MLRGLDLVVLGAASKQCPRALDCGFLDDLAKKKITGGVLRSWGIYSSEGNR